jgi:D-sorbitol dehydrogenase-like protein
MLEEFLALSRILTGVANLDKRLGQQYLDRLTSTPHDVLVRQILDRFRTIGTGEAAAQKVKDQILGDDALRPTVCQIVLLWYTSAMRDDANATAIDLRFASQEEYFGGLVWPILGAHIPGLSGGYFGHWRYRPENEPKGTR